MMSKYLETPDRMLDRLVALSTDATMSARDRAAVRFALELLDRIGRKMEEKADAGPST